MQTQLQIGTISEGYHQNRGHRDQFDLACGQA